MRGNSHVQFLGGGEVAILPCYPAGWLQCIGRPPGNLPRVLRGVDCLAARPVSGRDGWPGIGRGERSHGSDGTFHFLAGEGVLRVPEGLTEWTLC